MAKDLGGEVCLRFCAANGNGNAQDGAAHDISASGLRSSIRTTQIKLMLLVGLRRVGRSSRGYIIVAVVLILSTARPTHVWMTFSVLKLST